MNINTIKVVGEPYSNTGTKKSYYKIFLAKSSITICFLMSGMPCYEKLKLTAVPDPIARYLANMHTKTP